MYPGAGNFNIFNRLIIKSSFQPYKTIGNRKIQNKMGSSIIDNILVFKTNITSSVQVASLAEVLDTTDDIEDWNIDIQDCDHILRVVSRGIGTRDVIASLKGLGFHCEELEG